MIALLKMTNWHQIDVNLDNPEDVEKIKTLLNEGCVVVLAFDRETLDEEDKIKIEGNIEQ